MIIWIASYPKSGNTWIRSLLSSYFFSDDGNFSFKLLKNIKQFSGKSLSTDLSDGINYQARISKNWIPEQEKINRDKKIRFFKTHNAICTINGNKFTDTSNTLAAIYVVRDPRDLIISLAHHYELSLDDAFDFITNKKKIIFPINDKDEKKAINNHEDFNFLSDWPTHYKSWKNINFCPIKIIKYEDCLKDAHKVFLSILDFLSKFMKFKFEEIKINNSLKSTSFENLKKMESKIGFDESATSSKTMQKIRFFNLGKKNNWQTLSEVKLIRKIESQFRNEMNELGYL